ncbi:biotin/lipoyl-binding protein, partial [Methylogaea oryzae]|uniref:biotin/lipoyl-binding protein n=1 Tax=Methylogaea oryzae TaxID=1295382 RepID=UPI0020D0B9CE
VVCDEPTSALDHETGHKVMALMREVAMTHDRSLVIVTHDARIFGFADRIARMDDGHIESVTTQAPNARRRIPPMLRKYLLPALALAGFLFGIITVVQGNQPQPPSQPVVQPPAAPFASFIAGAGIVEARNRNIQIGTPLSGVVTEVAVKVGDRVKAGDLLFRLDDRQYLAQEALAQAAVSHARAQLNDASTQLRLAQSITDRRAISTEEL